VPVKLYTTAREQRVSFHLLHDQDRVRLRQRVVCSLDNRPVDREHLVRGVAIANNKYVIFRPSELQALEPVPGRSIQVLSFASPEQIDPRYYQHAYWLGPDSSQFDKKYNDLHKALQETKQVGICQWVMRKKSYIGALKSDGAILYLISLLRPDEVVSTHSFAVPQVEISEREKKTAQYLLETLSSSFQPEQYRSTFQNELREFISKKAQGITFVPKFFEKETTSSDQLLAALEASLKQAKQGREQAHART
jgi:DNA end-binding protein Ku